MPLKPDVEKKVMQLGVGEAVNLGFLDIFKAMANEGDIDDAPAKTIILPFYDASSDLQPGDWAPELHFVIRKVSHVEPEAATPESGL